MIPNIGLFDVSLSIFYLLIIYVLAVIYRNKKIDNSPEYKYFLIALTAKIIGAVGFAAFSIYYYKGGDTFVFFNAAEGLREYFFTNFREATNVMFMSVDNLDLARYNFAPAYNYILKSADVFAIVKITSVINIFSFGSYLATSILFGFASFLGLWFGYVSLCKLYPQIAKYMLLPFFLIPSALLWSSGVLKDTVTIGIIGWMLYAVANVFIFKRKLLFSIIITIIGAYIMLLLKPYILYVLLPCMLIWVQSNVRNMIESSLIKALVTPFVLVVLVVSGYFITQEFSKEAGKYNIENIGNTLKGFHSWHEYLSENRSQSGYTLGEMEFTPLGILKKAPAALNVTFFRPYLWEVRNVPTLLGGIESIVVLLFFLYVFTKIRFKIFKYLFKNKEAVFSITFALIFGVVVGVSSYNFGALSRYKIPAQLFFVLALILVWYQYKQKTKLN